MDGLLVIDKPEGPTSHDVVARLRRLLRERAIGHTGTLDPMATGVLPLVLGRATRLARFLTSDAKRYEAVVRLGQATDTYDRLGEPRGERVPVAVDEMAVERALDAFRGDIVQTPPPYSAKKIGGVSAHRLARRGEAVTPAAVPVTVYGLALVAAEEERLTLDVHCSAGFYVRSLAHDLGAALGCGAHLDALRRTASGDWTLADAVPLAECEADADLARSRIVPMAGLLTGWPTVTVTAEGERRLRHGQLLRPADLLSPPHAAAYPPLPHESPGRGRGGQGGEGVGTPATSGAEQPGGGARSPTLPSVRVLDATGALLALASPRPGGLLHPGLVLV